MQQSYKNNAFDQCMGKLLSYPIYEKISMSKNLSTSLLFNLQLSLRIEKRVYKSDGQSTCYIVLPMVFTWNCILSLKKTHSIKLQYFSELPTRDDADRLGTQIKLDTELMC